VAAHGEVTPMSWDLAATYVLPVLLLAAAATLFAAWVAWRGELDRADSEKGAAEPAVAGAEGAWAARRREAGPHAQRMLWAIRGAVLAWGAVLAAGAYRLNHNPWRVVMVLGCVVAFLGAWSWLTARREPKAAESSGGPPDAAALRGGGTDATATRAD
jgi:hypothetical protein